MSVTLDSIPALGVGLGLRGAYVDDLLAGDPVVPWLEVVPENYMDRGGRLRQQLLACSERYALASHGVAMNLGSTDPLDFDYLRSLKRLIRNAGMLWASDHLCFTGVGDRIYSELLPLPYTEEAASHLASRIRVVMDFLEVPFLVENVSSYFEHDVPGAMRECEFVTRVASEADCGILLDVNNVFVNSMNHGFDALEYLDTLPFDRVRQMHMAGHAIDGDVRLDTHGAAVADEVWDLFEEAVARLPRAVPVLLERDQNIPPLAELLEEVERMRRVLDARFPVLAAGS